MVLYLYRYVRRIKNEKSLDLICIHKGLIQKERVRQLSIDRPQKRSRKTTPTSMIHMTAGKYVRLCEVRQVDRR